MADRPALREILSEPRSCRAKVKEVLRPKTPSRSAQPSTAQVRQPFHIAAARRPTNDVAGPETAETLNLGAAELHVRVMLQD